MWFVTLDRAVVARGFGVAFGDKTILADLNFAMASEGVTVLMGPAGTGKSTLLRSLSWQNQQNPRFRSWGSIELGDQELTEDCHATLVAQNASLLNTRVADFLAEQIRQSESAPLSPAHLRQRIDETLHNWNAEDLSQHLDKRGIDLPREAQRRVAIIGGVLSRPSLLLLDEPTSGLEEQDTYMILDLIAEIGRSLPLMVVLHNQQQARMIGDEILLLAGGRIQAAASVQQFFSSPPNDVARHFVRTGSCNVPSPNAAPETLCANTAPVPPPVPKPAAPPPRMPSPTITAQVAAIPEYRGPRGFRWIVPSKVATIPLPGAVIDINHDMAALRAVGVTTLITLTYNDLPQDALKRHGLRNVHLPIYDRQPPSIGQLKMLTKRMTEMIERGDVLAVHCRAGIGRTGTIVAGWLIKEGLTAQAALDRIRSINKHYVQTEEQEQFLFEFEQHLLSSL